MLTSFFFIIALLFQSPEARASAELDVDLKRYTGKWYEVARLPNSFQEQCLGNVTATYHLRASGEIDVVNSCLEKGGKETSAEGLAWVVKPCDPRKLKVSFVPLLKYFHLFGGDYWIWALDPDYQWAIVGNTDQKYMWILSRTPQLPEQKLSELLMRAKHLGFSLDSLILTKQGL